MPATRALLVALLLSLACTASAAPRVRVGEVEFAGLPSAGGAAFLGIPYAAAPTGALRWAPPQPWKPETTAYLATRFADGCMQNPRMVAWYHNVIRDFGGDPATFEGPRFSEDCLYLNVWTPSLRPAAPLPVIVWIHGGSNTGGWSFEPNYHGEALAQQGVVVVSVAYRLGVFGFFSLPGLAQSNFGLLDQIAALGWVRTHIAAFGGDPAHVTVAGESAGGSDVASLLASPRAKGLFRRAIVQSGGYVLNSAATREQEFARGLELARAAGAADDAEALARLRALDAARLQSLVDAQGLTDFDPVVDGDTVIEPPAAAIAAGRVNTADLLAGSNADEWKSYVEAPIDEAGWIAANAPAGQAVLQAALSGEQDPVHRMDLLISAQHFVCPALWLARHASTDGSTAWVYLFTRVREGAKAQSVGAYHGAEIPYVFGTHDAWLPTTDADRALGARMMHYWSRFAATGNPNGPGDPDWPAFSVATPRIMQLDREPRALASHPSVALCAALGPQH